MAIDSKTTKEISDNILAQLEATFGSSMPKSFTRVISKVLAGVFVILYKYCGFIALQMFVSTASMRPTVINGKTVVPLIEWGRLIGAGDPLPATQAVLLIRVTAETIGAILPNNAQFTYGPTSVVYMTKTSTVLDDLTTEVEVVAVSDPSQNGGAGTIGNLAPGSVLSLANPLSGVSRQAVVISQVEAGTEAETDDQYRRRVTTRFQLRPQGGAYADYKLWAEETPGVANAYPYTSEFPGQVKVYIESAIDPDGIPTTGLLQAALDSINYDNSTGMATRRPVGALVNTFPIVRTGFDVEIQGLSVENEPDVRTSIEQALTKYFLDREPFLVGLSIPPRMDRITQAAVSGVVDDIVSLANGIFTDVVLRKSGVVTTTYTLGQGEKAKLSGVTYT